MLLTTTNTVKITGFLASGVVPGTGRENNAWACPEVRACGDTSTLSVMADVYSFAATIFEIMSYPQLPPGDPAVLRRGHATWGLQLNTLVEKTATDGARDRISMPAVVKALEIVMYGPQRWEFDVGKLTLLQELGRGQFGVVQKMTARGLVGAEEMTLVAAKSLRGDDMSPIQEAEFLTEMQLMMKLRHPNLVNLLGVCTLTKPYHILLELLPGGSLEHWLARNANTATPRDQGYVLYQVALGMTSLHEVGILHRDLAARNVLVGRHLTCKVSDFGLSREISSDREYYRLRSNHHAMPLRWMAPEVCWLTGLLS
jgi:hypothetical protein